MAKPPSVSEGEIREGFICPICLCDLKTVDQLQDHFELTHSSEDHDVFQALKGFIDKAKRKILKQDTWSEDLTRDVVLEQETLYQISRESVQWPMQDIGLTTNHTQYYKKLRDKRIDRYVLETNKLLIRLDKLICDIAEEPDKRKEFEKSIVPWVPDSDVPLCPGCAKSFGLSRRRHHCRLCGGVMCQSCSCFLNYDFARKLTVPVVSDDQRLLPKSQHVTRRPSSASLMSVVNMGGEHLIRICKDCHVLLERHDKLIEQKNHKPVIVQMYERLKDYKDEIERLVPVYLDMLHSLNSGETDHQLQEAKDLHMKISKLAERVDAQSKRILNLEVSPEENNSRTIQLNSGIRMAASQFLRNVILGLPVPPSQEEITHYQNIRQEQMQRRIEIERQSKKKEASKSPSPVTTPKQIVSSNPVSPDKGWCVITDRVQEEEDPMLQQIKIINKYIQQAKMDHKYDELQMLENNLKELQLEYARQKKS